MRIRLHTASIHRTAGKRRRERWISSPHLLVPWGLLVSFRTRHQDPICLEQQLYAPTRTLYEYIDRSHVAYIQSYFWYEPLSSSIPANDSWPRLASYTFWPNDLEQLLETRDNRETVIKLNVQKKRSEYSNDWLAGLTRNSLSLDVGMV